MLIGIIIGTILVAITVEHDKLDLVPYEGIIRFSFRTPVIAHRNVHGTRYYEQSITKLSEAIDVFNRRKLDFMIELGDLKDMGDIPERGQTLSFLDEIEAKFQTFDGPVYHVLGNHDMDSISKSEFLAHTSNYGSAKGKPYYSFCPAGTNAFVQSKSPES